MNELEIELNNIDPQEFFTNENISSLRSHFPKLKIVQRGELFKVLGEKKSLDDYISLSLSKDNGIKSFTYTERPTIFKGNYDDKKRQRRTRSIHFNEE